MSLFDDQIDIIHGESLVVLKAIAADSFDSMVTDPPAGISWMGATWDSDKGGRAAWVAWMTEVMQECLRVLKPGAHALVWSFARTQHWTALALEDAGFEIRDVICHLHGQGMPKSLDVSKAIDKAAGATREVVGTKAVSRILNLTDIKVHNYATGLKGKGGFINVTAPATEEAKKWAGWQSALKPAYEPWILVRKPLAEKNIASNVVKYSTGAINIDATRTADKRWPSNVTFEHHEKCFEGKCWEDCTVYQLECQKSQSSKFFYIAKASSKEKNEGCEALYWDNSGTLIDKENWKELSEESKRIGNIHSTVKPISLMRHLIRLVTPPGGCVLDPFAGSGTAGCAAILEECNFIGIELDRTYAAIARARIKHTKETMIKADGI